MHLSQKSPRWRKFPTFYYVVGRCLCEEEEMARCRSSIWSTPHSTLGSLNLLQTRRKCAPRHSKPAGEIRPSFSSPNFGEMLQIRSSTTFSRFRTPGRAALHRLQCETVRAGQASYPQPTGLFSEK